MQKAAEERPLIGERKGPYAIGESSSEAVREAPPSALIHHAFLSLDCARPGGDPDRQSLRWWSQAEKPSVPREANMIRSDRRRRRELRWSRLFGQLPGKNKLKAWSRLLISPFPEIKIIPCCCGVLW